MASVARVLDEQARRLRRLELRHADLRRAAERLERMRATQELAETVVEGTTATVRAVHHGIASIPFGILEAIPPTRDVTRLVHGIHDVTADAVYGAISLANRLVGGGLRKGLLSQAAPGAVEQKPELPVLPKADEPKDAE